MASDNNNGGRLWRAVEYLVAVIVSINTVLTGYQLSATATLREDVAGLKASSFNASDGLELWRELARVKMEAYQVSARLEAKVDSLMELKSRLERIEQKIDKQ